MLLDRVAESGVKGSDRRSSASIRRTQGGDQSRRVVTLEECGRIIGKIIAPTSEDVFGPWCGAVYLNREHCH